jgi:hypothetical protein
MKTPCLGIAAASTCVAFSVLASNAFSQTAANNAATSAPATRPVSRTHQGTVYYVANGGDDNGPGSVDHPFATIQHAANVAWGRDVVKIAAGVYPEHVVLPHSGAYFGRTIRFEGAGPDKTIIDAQLPGDAQPAKAARPGRAAFDTSGQDYLVITGIGVRNSQVGFGIFSSWEVSLENCRAFNTTDSGIKIDKSGRVGLRACEIQQACWHGGEESLSVKRSNDVQILNCHIHDTGHEGIDIKEGSKHVRVIGNQVDHVERQGLYTDAWDSPTFDIRFEDNRVHDCMFGVAVGSEAGGLLSDIWLVNNVVYNNRGPGIILADWGEPRFAHPVKDVHILRNTVWHNGTQRWGGGMVFENTDVTDLEIANNIFSQNTRGQLFITKNKLPPGVSLKANVLDGVSEQIGDNLVGTVQFTAADKGDFSIVSGPKGMDAGARPIDPPSP